MGGPLSIFKRLFVLIAAEVKLYASKMHYISRCLILLLTGLSLASLQAQKYPADVKNVDFNSNVRPYGWNNIVIEIEANENPDPNAPNSRYVDNIRVSLLLGYEGPKDGEFTFYNAEATVVTIETGDSKLVGFWMPFDIVERDDLPREPKFWIVELEVDGKALDLLQNSKSFSSSFPSRESIENFKRQANSKLTETEGILVPTYLSPNPYVDSREPPAFIRLDQQ